MTGATHTSRSIDPARLTELGKTAAELSASSGLSLTESVIRTVGMEKLNSQQVRRVVESANHEAYHQKYSKTSGQVRAVHFDDGPADPEVVMSALKTAAAPRAVEAPTTDYDLPPSFQRKTASVVLEPVYRTKAGARQSVFDLQHQLGTAHEEAVAGAEVSKVAMTEAFVSLRDLTASALRSGATADDLIWAWSGLNQDMAKLASERFGLRCTGIKTAGFEINLAHPVVTTFVEFVRAAEEFQGWTTAISSIESEMLKIASWLKGHAA